MGDRGLQWTVELARPHGVGGTWAEPWKRDRACLRGDDDRIHLLPNESNVVNKTLDRGVHEACLGDHTRSIWLD